MIKVSDLYFQFEGASTAALNNVTLKINDGEFTIITGPSGSGKSTLCLSMCGFIPHGYDGTFKGEVIVNSKNTKENSVFELAEEIGIIQQDPESQICTLNVTDEVAFGPENFLISEEETNKRIKWALKTVDASHLSERKTSSLSGGEKQRLAIASVLALKPKILILDEPTSQLDPKGTARIFSIITDLQRQNNMTIVVVEHKLHQVLPLSSRVIVMNSGEIVVDTPTSKLNSYSRMLKEIGVRLPARRVTKKPAHSMHRSGSACEVTDLYVNSPDGERILEDVSFNVRNGEVVGLMGDNGSGKTTLLLSLLGLWKSHSGDISIHGRSAATMTLKERCRHFGLIFQNPNHQIFENTVLREVSFAPANFGEDEKHIESKALRLLDTLNLISYRDRHPFSLSYGEKRRLNLASVLIYEPSILLMDEPFVGQDFINVQKLMRFIEDSAERGRSTIMVIHDPELAEMYCDRLIFLRHGKVIVNETTETAFQKLAQLGEHAYTTEWREVNGSKASG